MKEQYPMLVYKTKEDRKKVNNIDEQEAAANEGYGRYSITVLGIKPAIPEKEEIEEATNEILGKGKVESIIPTKTKTVIKKRKKAKR